MAIHTEKPGGGDDRVRVHVATSPDEAKRARAALEEVGVTIDLPDQAIDAIFAANPKAELPVQVALRDASKAIKAISTTFTRREEPSAIATAADPRAAAAETLAAAPAPADAGSSEVVPATAVERQARKALLVSMMSIFLPPAGFLGALMGLSVLLEIHSRPDEKIAGSERAKIAIALGVFVGFVGSFGFVYMLKSGVTPF